MVLHLEMRINYVYVIVHKKYIYLKIEQAILNKRLNGPGNRGSDKKM